MVNLQSADLAELERFKTGLDVVKLATQQFGYGVDRAESTPSVAVLRREADNAKVIIRIGRNSQWMVYDARQDRSGSIIDLVQWECPSESLGAIRKRLRAFMGTTNPLLNALGKDGRKQTSSTPTSPVLNLPDASLTVQADEPDRKKVAAVWSAATWIAEHPYLLQRSIPRSTLNDPRFKDCWRMDKRGNAVFLHHDTICHYILL